MQQSGAHFRRLGTLSIALVITLGISLTTPNLVPAASAADLPQPTVHYQFDADDLSSGTIADTSGNDLDATLVNGATATMVEDGRGGSALNLPGGGPTSDGAYLRLPLPALAGATDLTVSIRVKWDGTTAPWQWIYALGKDTTRYLFSTPYNGNGRLRTAVTSRRWRR